MSARDTGRKAKNERPGANLGRNLGSDDRVISIEEFLRRKRVRGKKLPSRCRRIKARELWGMPRASPVACGTRDLDVWRGKGEDGDANPGGDEELRRQWVGLPYGRKGRRAQIGRGVTGKGKRFALGIHRCTRDTGRQPGVTGKGKRFALGMVFLSSVIALAWVYLFSDLVVVRHFETIGLGQLEKGYLVSLSGIQEGSHLLKVNTEEAEARILTDMRIRDVRVNRRFPNTVLIQVWEREPIAFVEQNGLFFLLDREGLVYAACGERPTGAVEFRLSPAPVLYVGKRLEEPENREVLEVLTKMPRLAAMAERVGREERGVYLDCGGVRVIVGDSGDFQRKESIALGSLKAATAKGIRLDYVDVRLPDHPVWKPLDNR